MKTFTIPENKKEPANMNGVRTNNADYIIKILEQTIGEYKAFKTEGEGERIDMEIIDKLTATTF
jgi:hypothetical protein